MDFVKKMFLVLGILTFLAIPRADAFAQTVLAPLPTGTLVRALGDSRIYYIEYGLKRQISSPEAFRVQGFSALIKDITPVELATYPDGEPIGRESTLMFPGQTEVMPDLAPFAAKDLQLVNRDGRMKLLFTTVFWNRGKGPLELRATAGQSTANDVYETAQRIVLPNGSVRNKIVGNLFWHAIHKHFHYDNFGSYILEMVPPSEQALAPRSQLFATPALPGLIPIASILGESTVAPAIKNKSTFCIYETQSIALPTEGVKRPTKTYSTCGKFSQGISVGWADKYDYTLPDQNFDVTDLPPGIYRLSFVLDPLQNFMEGNQGNNSSVAFVDLNPQAGTMTVLAAGAPFATPENRYPDGMLVRSENDPTIYVLQNNRKKLAPAQSSGQVFILPQSVLDAIPSLSLIRVDGSPTVYVVNDSGFRRGIISEEVFRSYSWSFQNVAVINSADLANYPATDLVKMAGDNTVYSISARRPVGTSESLSRLGLNPASVHVINQLDFEAYMVGAVATGLFVPWDTAFLPDGDMLVPERSGALRRIGRNPAVITVPAVLDTGEGGLMGLALHPAFAQNSLLYLYFTTAEGGQKNRVARFRLDGNQLLDRKIIIDNIPSAIYHDGGRIAFGPDGMLYITTGDANNPDSAQDLGSLAGKTLRLTPNGQIPADNPFGTAVWSYGHRNGQGLAWDSRGRLWETEHGRSGALSGFDELNLIEKGKNYGWPVIQGDETRAGMVTPVRNSGANETWAPAGIAFANGSLYFAGLRGSALYQVSMDNNGVIGSIQKHLSGKFGRLRAVVLGSDGALYISTSNRDGRGTILAGDDKILRVYPGLLPGFR